MSILDPKNEEKTAVNTDKNDFKTLFQNYAVNIPKVGEIIKGAVVAVERGGVHIDISGLTTGVVRGRELFVESSEYANLKVGDEAEATVLELENENGEMELSFRSAGFRKAWDQMKKLMKDGVAIKAKVTGANKGGLIMQVDAISGFMPVSQLSPDNYPRVAGGDKMKIFEKLKEIVGKEVEVKVIDVNEMEEKLIVSERAVWEDSQKAVLDTYKVGDAVDGEISALTTFGAFMKFGEGLEGLIHISEIAWQRIDHPKDVLKVGQKVKAQIIQLDHAKIYLSIKRTVEDPWKKAKDKFTVGSTVKGRIIKIENFGLMVALDTEIHGLAHVSELSDTPVANLNDKFKVGQEMEFEIVNLEPAEHRLGLKVPGVKGKAPKKPAKAVEEKKTEEKPAEEKSVEKSVEEKSVEEKTEEKPVETAPAVAEEKPVENKVE
ncbi:MAG: S1 RNA-binding domain-containing protein [Candidatus Magasanikbacteria bacterium]|nr:S1 RNA-binding domain-containing protein [Candidatus Magasanikbacteria bacterium]